jgi:deoxyribose-phosphate aldolase
MPRPLADSARLALSCLDLTSLNDHDSAADIDRLCERAHGAHGCVAAVCVWPRFVAQARALLPQPARIAAVANFPDGALDTHRALRDVATIGASGGDEVDLVLPWRAFLAGERRTCAALVAAVRRAAPGMTLKLIIESGELGGPDPIRTASQLGLDEGVDFLKTSTGKRPISATPDAARVMLETIARDARAATVGFKAAGGIRRVADAAVYLDLVAEHLGASALVPARCRLGASSLLDDIDAVLVGIDAAEPGGTYQASHR